MQQGFDVETPEFSEGRAASGSLPVVGERKVAEIVYCVSGIANPYAEVGVLGAVKYLLVEQAYARQHIAA